MKAKEEYLTRFLEGARRKFIIPVYQRPYRWKKENCELLLKDLKSVAEKTKDTHFFGGIVHIAKDDTDDEMHIVDGQQRITTVSLLLLAILNYIKENDLESGVIDADEVFGEYVVGKYNKETKLKLKLSGNDGVAYSNLLSSKEKVSNSQITINYELFYGKLSEMPLHQVEGIYLAIKKLMIIDIALYIKHGDDPQLIFESLNSTGQKLTESEKIQNYILMNLSADKQDVIYERYWLPIEQKTDKQLDQFIQYYLAIKTRETSKLDSLYFVFKKYRENKADISIEDIASDILRYANYFHSIRNASSNSGYWASIERLNFLKINTIYPLLMDFFEAKAKEVITEDELNEMLETLESYLARRILCNMSTGTLNKMFVSMGLEIEKLIEKHDISYFEAFTYSILSKSKNSRFPTDNEFEENFEKYELYNAKSETRKYILERLENYNNRERVDVNGLLAEGKLSIEHIMPQSLTKEWKAMLGSNWENIHVKWKDRIGNLTLSAYNSDYSNLSFEKKKTMPEKGFEFSKLFLNQFIKEQSAWAEEEIVDRSEVLFKKAKKIWKLPKTTIDIKLNSEIVSLEDDIDFTGKSISKYILLGDEIISNDITDAYKKIMVTLCDLDEFLLVNATSHYFGKDSFSFRKPYEISKGFFIETNLSSNSKIEVLKSVLELFEIELSELHFEIRDKKKVKEFDVTDISTYENCKIGELAKGFISYLLLQGKLDNELELLMDKEYSTNTFGMYYPVMSLNRETGSTVGKPTRYYKNPVEYKGKKYYITTEWFEDFRPKLLAWFDERV